MLSAWGCWCVEPAAPCRHALQGYQGQAVSGFAAKPCCCGAPLPLCSPELGKSHVQVAASCSASYIAAARHHPSRLLGGTDFALAEGSDPCLVAKSMLSRPDSRSQALCLLSAVDFLPLQWKIHSAGPAVCPCAINWPWQGQQFCSGLPAWAVLLYQSYLLMQVPARRCGLLVLALEAWQRSTDT